MKKVAYILLFCFVFNYILPITQVFAEVNYTFGEGTFHVVWIKASGISANCDNVSTMSYDNTNIEYIKSFNTYALALEHLKTLTSSDLKTLAIIGDRKDKSGNHKSTILYSDYALVDLNTTGSTATTSYMYTSSSNTSVYTYINGHGMFGAVDAAFIDYNNDTTRANIKIAGATGWINSLINLKGTTYTGYDIVPLVSVKSPSYYYVNNDGELVHKLSKKITANNCYIGSANNLGPAPEYLISKDTTGKMIQYYSYDGNYFYTTLESMLDDYKENSTKRAINDIPYYNYYMYLPIRSKTNMTAQKIREFLESRNYTTETSSALYGEETTFIDAEDKYGVNALMSFSTAINESGWGTSTLAKQKNNIFGHNAIDSDVMSAADGYKTVADGIYRHAYYMINTGFAETKDAVARYYGSHLGNKESGINVKYASDPYWGEKIASHFYVMDNYNDLEDYYKYTIGIKVSEIDVDIKKEATTSSKTLYQLKSYYHSVKNVPIIILDRVIGEEINGNNIWYKIQSDALLDTNREDLIQDSTIEDLYDWNNNYAYVHSSYITLMDESVQNIYIKKEGIFGLENLLLNDEKNGVNIKVYLAIKGIDNTKSNTITYDVIFQDQTMLKTYELPLNRIMDTNNIRFEVTNNDDYDYTYSWFDGNINLDSIPQGNYTIYVRARSGGYESKEILSNLLFRDIVNQFTNENGRGYEFRTNYYLKTIPIELFIRDEGLMTKKEIPTYDNMFNQYRNIDLKENNLVISGTSFNIGGNYSTETEVTRKIIFENINTFKRYEYDLGYIDNGEYVITLAVPDNLDKTRAWFSNKINLTELEKGVYAIYIKTISNVEDCAELVDIFNKDINNSMTIDEKAYNLKVNENQRFRVELFVK